MAALDRARRQSKGMPEALAATPVVHAAWTVSRLIRRTSGPCLPHHERGPARDAQEQSLTVWEGMCTGAPTVGSLSRLGILSLAMEPNGPWRTEGERLKVDPNNGDVVFLRQLERRSLAQPRRRWDWTVVKGGGAPPASDDVLGVHLAPGRAARPYATRRKCSRTIFAVIPRSSVLMQP